MTYLARVIAMKVATLPTCEEARLWSEFRLSRGPMNVEQYARRVELCDRESADSLLTLQARTSIGWYAASWFKWLTGWNVALYEELGRHS